jgi:hypothetical protein
VKKTEYIRIRLTPQERAKIDGLAASCDSTITDALLIAVQEATDKRSVNKLPEAQGWILPPRSQYWLRWGKRWVLDSQPGPGWSVVVLCPFCGYPHVHGWDPEETEKERIMTRISHCNTESYPNEYRIVIQGTYDLDTFPKKSNRGNP